MKRPERPTIPGRRPPGPSGAPRALRSPTPSASGNPWRVLRATLEYDGSRYRGWQIQANARSVQGELTRALHETLAELGEETGTARIHGAGRTDAKVHALGQVASLHLHEVRRPLDLRAFRYSLNDRLPADINVLSLAEEAPTFHARHAAALRIYRYRISRRRTAFGKPFVYWVREPLDPAAMARAAAAIVGRHDFAAFCERPQDQESTLVEVSLATVEVPAAAPDLVIVRLAASHFLWKMVRRLVGVLLEVGAGRLPEDEIARLLLARSSRAAEWTAPPSGLFLEAVVYPGEPVPPPADPLRPAF